MAALSGAELQAVFKKARQSIRDKAKQAGAPLYYKYISIKLDCKMCKCILIE